MKRQDEAPSHTGDALQSAGGAPDCEGAHVAASPPPYTGSAQCPDVQQHHRVECLPHRRALAESGEQASVVGHFILLEFESAETELRLEPPCAGDS